ncbi:hypothetical protein ABT297_24815 [Dactylosporangium sp. NPDC000555]|uniref:hypothetical protein n=1 Tax=Dactylosporangium sp. NPDC000555 TaxID=3154260 RepID=UPI003327E69C
MANRQSDPLSWVALGCFDVNPADLDGAGYPWGHVIPTERVIRADDDTVQRLPHEGWRELTIQTEGGRVGQARLFAAPHNEGWAMVHVSAPVNGVCRLSANPGPVHPRPGRPSRRQGLLLTWPEGLRTPAASLNGLSVTLINIGDTVWSPDAEEAQYVHAWLLDERGERIGLPGFAYRGHRQDLHDLTRGQLLSLPVDFGSEATRAAAGVYGVQAVMPSLNLWSTRGTVVVL